MKDLLEKQKQQKLHGPPFRDEMLKMSFLINQFVEIYKNIKRITF